MDPFAHLEDADLARMHYAWVRSNGHAYMGQILDWLNAGEGGRRQVRLHDIGPEVGMHRKTFERWVGFLIRAGAVKKYVGPIVFGEGRTPNIYVPQMRSDQWAELEPEFVKAMEAATRREANRKRRERKKLSREREKKSRLTIETAAAITMAPRPPTIGEVMELRGADELNAWLA